MREKNERMYNVECASQISAFMFVSRKKWQNTMSSIDFD